MTLRQVFSFPNPANDYAARMVAGMVVGMSLGVILLHQHWLLLLLAYGFLARVLTGPTLSPAGLLATRVLTPLFGNHMKPVPGPPKRFAQGIGVVFSWSAMLLHFAFGMTGAAYGVLGVLTLFASLEAFLGFCMGCYVFGWLMRWGVIPASVCESCYDIGLRRGNAKA
ncbi:MAG: DUF4395 domain-containing protein [Chloroflexi bacterium]|nr:DUF4395 domain-containing protein [Chloroflexota bacterium]